MIYKITNYGNTRCVYIKGQTWEISKNCSIKTDNKEVAEAFEKLQFVDVTFIEQSNVKVQPSKQKKKAASMKKNKKIKRCNKERKLK